MAIIALDIGSKKIGVALSEYGCLSRSLGIWDATPHESFIHRLARTAHEHKVSKVIVGLPLINGQETAQARFTREIGEKIGKGLGLPITYTDEEGSTQEAGESKQLDDLSAQIILERHLAECPVSKINIP